MAVVVGTAINPTRERRPPNLPGITIRTLWGEIAAQLAEQAGDPKLFNRVRSADRKGVPPGSDALRGLFDACGPCLILIDELVAYARKIYGVDGLPAGSFDAVQTFIQELTEAVRASRNTVLVATIPESDIEIGGDAGRETLARIEHTFGRMEAVWKPVGSEEGFEVVRRRLFLPIDDEPARDEVCRAFGALYRENGADFPAECREGRYLERLKACYPIHPEVFERLYGDWSTLERFQRTRGVLRLMAAVIHDLWVRNDAGLLILPGSVGLDASAVRDELTRYLPEGWTPVLEGDVDGPNAGPFRVDAENPRFGQIVAARRVARTIFLGSAPHVAQQQVRGLEDVRLRLGAVQPGEQVAVFNDAASQLAERLTYLYRKGRRYWYDTRPNLRRTVAERAQQVGDDDVERELERRLREVTRRDRGDFQGVHPCPASHGDVPDEPAARLVILGRGATHAGGAAASKALDAARDLLFGRGKGPRQHQNMLAFLAPDREVMEGLEQEARRLLAWRSVVRDHEALNLDAHQRREAADGEKASDETVRLRVNEAWRWLLVPVQHASAEGVSGLQWDVAQIAAGGDSVATRVSRRMRSSEQLIVRWSPALLKMELDRWVLEGPPARARQAGLGRTVRLLLPAAAAGRVGLRSHDPGRPRQRSQRRRRSRRRLLRLRDQRLPAGPLRGPDARLARDRLRRCDERARQAGGRAHPARGRAAGGGANAGGWSGRRGRTAVQRRLRHGFNARARGRRPACDRREAPTPPLLRHDPARPPPRRPRHERRDRGSRAAPECAAGGGGRGVGGDLGFRQGRRQRERPAHRRRELQGAQVPLARLRRGVSRPPVAGEPSH